MLINSNCRTYESGHIQKVEYKKGFTLVEILVTAGLIIIIVAMLIPVLGKAKEAARYAAWSTMSKNRESDSRVSLYYSFEEQSGTEISASGEPIILNRATGDPMGVVSSEGSDNGASDPTLRYGVLKDSHPDDDTKGGLPTFQAGKGRFAAKMGMFFPGYKFELGNTIDTSGTDLRSDAPAGASTWGATSNEGGLIYPEFWAGIVDNGEFQIAMWVKLEDTLTQSVLVEWGDWSSPSASYNASTKGNYFAMQTPFAGGGATTAIRPLTIGTDGAQGSFFRDDEGTDWRVLLQDNNWNFIVLRLKKPYNQIALGLIADAEIPELDDLELSVNGSDFFPFAPPDSGVYEDLGGANADWTVNRRLERAIGKITFGGRWNPDSDPTTTGDYQHYTNGFIRGYMDEIIIWQEPTTEEEVKKMYKVGAPATERGEGFVTLSQFQQYLSERNGDLSDWY